MRQKTADFVIPEGAVDDREPADAVKAAVREAPAGDKLLLRTLARRHTEVLRALSWAANRTVRVLFFEPLPCGAEGCGDGAASDWAKEAAGGAGGARDDAPGRRRKGADYPFWARFDPPAAGPDSGCDTGPSASSPPASDADEIAASGAPDFKAAMASGDVCLLHLYDHHFDLLGAPVAKGGGEGGAEDADEGDTVSPRHRLLSSGREFAVVNPFCLWLHRLAPTPMFAERMLLKHSLLSLGAQDLLDLLAGDIKTLEEQTWGTWLDFRRLMSFGGVEPTPTGDDFGVLKDSRARYREMIEKVCPGRLPALFASARCVLPRNSRQKLSQSAQRSAC